MRRSHPPSPALFASPIDGREFPMAARVGQQAPTGRAIQPLASARREGALGGCVACLPRPPSSRPGADQNANVQAAPTEPLSVFPPTMAVWASADSATDSPCCARPTLPVPTSFDPCWVHTPPLRVNTQTAPWLSLSREPPVMAVLPSADSATEL